MVEREMVAHWYRIFGGLEVGDVAVHWWEIWLLQVGLGSS